MTEVKHHQVRSRAGQRRGGVLVALTLCAAAFVIVAAPTTGGAAPGVAWSQVGADIDSTGNRDLSGGAVSVSSDGNTVAIGATTDGFQVRSGFVRVMRFDGANWNQLGADIVGGLGDSFGFSVALSSDGETVAIGAIYNGGPAGNGAGKVQVYRLDGGNWNQLGADIDGEGVAERFGWSVSLSSDGETLAVGAPQNAEAGPFTGQARIFRLNGAAWSQVGADIDAEAEGDLFGEAVSLSADGTMIAIGARANDATGETAGHVRVLRFDGSNWSQLGGDIEGEAAGDSSGQSVALSADGGTVAVGAAGNDGTGEAAGHVRVLRLDGSNWSQLGGDIDGEAASDLFGSAVALSDDGNTVAAGAGYNDGAGVSAGHARVLRFDGSGWIQLGEDIDGEAAGDKFGLAVDLTSDGDKIAIGAIYNDGGALDGGHVRVLTTVVIPDVEITGTTQIYNGSPRTVTVTTDPAGLAHEVTYDGSATAPTNAGSYDVEVTITEPGHASDPDPVTATLTIEKAAQSIDFAALDDVTFGDGPFDVTAVATSGLDVQFSVAGACTQAGSTVTVTAAGACTVTATQPGDDDYTAATPVARMFAVARADAMTEISNASHTYDGSPHGADVATVPSDLDVTVTYDGSAALPTDSGTYEISVVVNDTNYDQTPVLGTLRIEQAVQTVDLEAPASTPVDGDSFDVLATSSSGLDVGLVAVGPCTIVGSTVSPTGTGDCVITATQAGDDNHLAAAPVDATIVVTTAALSITGLPDQIAPGDTITVGLTGFESGEVVDLVLRSDPVNVGQAVTDGQGAAQVEFVVPSHLDAGVHTLTATGRTSALSVAVSATLVVPTVSKIDTVSGDALPTTGSSSSSKSILGLLMIAIGLAFVVVGEATKAERSASSSARRSRTAT